MYKGILSAKIAKATPEFKFFLLTCIRYNIEIIEPFIETKALAAQFKVGVRTLYRALRFFAESGHFTEESVKTKGRPGVRYRLVSNIDLKPYAKIPKPLSLYPRLVDFILFGRESEVGGELGVRDRLLLAVLLNYSDDCGVVRSLGASDLAALTGIGKAGIPGRLEKLRMYGYIRASVPGVNGAIIFQKSKSIHFLDLSLPTCCSPFLSPAVICEELYSYYSNSASRLMKGARIIASSARAPEARRNNRIFQGLRELHLNKYQNALMETAKVFMNHPHSGVMQYLQVKIEEYAAFVLPNVLGGDDFTADETLRAKIEGDIVVRSDQDGQLKKTLIDILTDISIVTAREIVGVMSEGQRGLAKKNARFVIAPSANGQMKMLLASSCLLPEEGAS